MRVLTVYSGATGVEYHRLFVPFMNIAKEHYVQRTDTLDGADSADYDRLAENFDVVVFNRNISNKMIPQVIFENLKRRGVKIVIDVDDYWYLPKHHVLYQYYKDSAFSECTIWQMRHADEVWVSTKRLGELCSRINRNVHVVHNAIDSEKMPTEGIKYGQKPFYQGSITHKKDLALIKNLPITVCGVGYIDGEPQQEWVEIMDMMPNAEFEEAIYDVREYHKLFDGKGICVIPLVDNKFNQCKSNLKMLEAGWFGKPIIVSNVGPYAATGVPGETHLAVNHNSEFEKYLTELSANEQMQQDLAGRMKSLVLRKYMISKANEIRLERLWKLSKSRSRKTLKSA